MYRLVSQANNLEVLLEGTSFEYGNVSKFYKKKNELFPFSFAIYNFICLNCLLIYMCNLKIFDIQYSPYS